MARGLQNMPYLLDMANSTKKYYATAMGVMNWAEGELEHVGRIAAVRDADIQYSYALSTVNGMLHLRDALTELINDPYYVTYKEDLTRTHDSVVRVIKKLIKDYSVNIETIRAFNTRKVLGNLKNFEEAPEPPPVAANGRPVGANGKPMVANGRPVGANGKPVGANGKPVAANGRPMAANGKPVGANGKPVETKANSWFWPF